MQIINFLKKRSKRLFFVLFLIFIFLLFLHPVSGDGDFFHHLNTGRYILQHKQLPQLDQWTYTALGKSWIANAWGTGVIYYMLYNFFGSNSISLFVAFQAVILFILLYQLLQSYQKNKITNLVALLLGFSIFVFRWPNRPELSVYLFLASILLIYKVKERYPKIVLLLPFLLLLWSMLYTGGVFVGLFLLLIIIVTQFYKDGLKFKKHQIKFYISSFLSFPVVLLNGYGLKSILYILLIPSIAKTQGEWAGILTILNGVSSEQLLYLQYPIMFFLIYITVIILLALYKRKELLKHPFESLIALGLISPFFAIRNIPLAVMLSLPLLAILLYNLEAKAKKIVAIILISLALIFCLTSWINTEHGVGRDITSFPKDIISYLNKNKLSGNFFVNQQIGSFISYYTYPKILVYSDTRDDLFINSFVITDYQNVVFAKKNVIPLLKKYGADMVLADSNYANSFQPLIYSKDWSLVFVDERYLLFVNKKIAKEKNLHDYTAIDPFAPNASKKGLEKQAISEYKEIVSQKYFFNNTFHLGQVLLDQKNFAQTIAVANKLQIPNDYSASLFSSRKNFLIATSYLLSNQCEMAKKYLDSYHNDLSHKLIFDWNKKLLGVDEKEYVIYYLICESNILESQKHLANYLNDPQVSTSEKNNAEETYNYLLKQINGGK